MLLHRNRQLMTIINIIVQAEQMGQLSCLTFENITEENFRFLVNSGYTVSENTGPTQISWSKK
jgi:hypothetical protein